MSMLTPENREKLLDEEKRYWQETCLHLREQREDMAHVIRTQNEELAKLRKDVKDQAARLSLITDIQKAMRKTGAPLPDWSLGGVTYEALSGIFVQVTEYEAPPAKPAEVDMSQLVLVAWCNKQNGSIYGHHDQRTMRSKNPGVRATSKGKVPLYAIRGTKVISEPDADDLEATI